MTRKQIQLPDDLYERARKVCESREISLAELVRRGLDYILSVYDPNRALPLNGGHQRLARSVGGG